MAELGLSTTSSSDVVTEIVQEDEETMEPPTKKKCKALPEPVELEERLNGILCCTVCLDLPTVSMLQVESKQFLNVLLAWCAIVAIGLIPNNA